MKKGSISFLLISCLSLLGLYSSAQTVGMLYGMSSSQTLYSYDPLKGKDSLLLAFTGTNGSVPYGNLLQANNGRLYGMTSAGGAFGEGVLFYYDITNGKDSVLFSFTGPNGANPYGSLIQATNGLLYGMALNGGVWNYGVVFCFNLLTGKDSVVLSFNDTDGMSPKGSLYQAKNGKLYGMTQYGGVNNDGVVFSLDPVTGKDSVLVSFNGTNGSGPVYGDLVQDTNGLLYGMTYGGGPTFGVLFSYNPVSGKDTVLLQFNINDGAFPYGSLVHDTNGVLYGMASNGGVNGDGVLFSYNPATFKDSVLLSFNGVANGSFPDGTPLLASNGLLYGVATQGGTNASHSGVLYSFNIGTDKDSVLVDFDNVVGGFPYDGLIEAMSAYLTSLDSVSCFGDSDAWAKIQVRGAKLPVSYLWSNGAAIDSIGNLKGGTYTCTVTDARGITLNYTVQIIQPPEMILTESVSNVCFGDSNGIAGVIASGGNPPYKYKWNNGATTDSIFNLKPGKDSCTVTDSRGCSSSIVETISQAAPFKIDSIVTTPASCPGCKNGTVKIYISGGLPVGDSTVPGYPYIYSWTPGGDSITVCDTLTIRGLAAGGLNIDISNACGLLQDSTTVPLGTATLSAQGNSVLIYPVPSKGQISVAMYGRGYESINISDEIGNEVYKSALDAGRDNYVMPLNLNHLSSGIYIMQVVAKGGTITRKLVIQK